MLKRFRLRFAPTPLKVKITSVIVAATMVCSVTGCGAENKQSNPLSDTSQIVSETSGSSEVSEISSISGVSNNPADSSYYANSHGLPAGSNSTFSETQEKSDTRSPQSSVVSTDSQSAQSSQSSAASASSQSTSNSPTIYTKVVNGVTFEYQMEYFDTSGRYNANGSVKFDTFDIKYHSEITALLPFYQIDASGEVFNCSECILYAKEYDKDGCLLDTRTAIDCKEKFKAATAGGLYPHDGSTVKIEAKYFLN